MTIYNRPPSEFELLDHLKRCSGFRSFQREIQTMLEKMGFDIYAISRLGSACETEAQISTFDPDLHKSYLESGFFGSDLLVEATRKATPQKLLYRSHIQSVVDTADFQTESFLINSEISRLFSSHGYVDIAVLPIEARSGEGIVFLTLVAHDTSVIDFQHKVQAVYAQALAMLKAVEFVGTDKFADVWLPPEAPAKLILPEKPLEIIELMINEDVSIDQAAYQLGKSRSTAYKQLEGLKKQLGVNTVHALTAELIRRGYIGLDDASSFLQSLAGQNSIKKTEIN